MFITPAYAQGAGGGSDLIIQMVPLLAMFVIFYFLLIRPQQARQKTHREMVAAIKRGDRVLLSSGIYGTVKKSRDGDTDLEVEIAKDTVVTILRSTVSQVLNKGDVPKDIAS